MEKRISSAVIHRMPRYYRHLCDLQDAGITRISSGTLAERMGRRGREIVEQKFDLRQIHSELLAIYRRVLGE